MSQLPAVPFGEWLRQMLAALAEDRPADVPCGSCNACCRTRHFVHVRAEERAALSRIPRALLFPAPGLPPGNMVMGYDDTGCCPMLVCSRCTIYEHRPIACRTYDCRIYAAAGIPADRGDIQARVEQWRFTYPAQADRDEQAAVRAAARFIQEHPACLADPVARRDPVRVAILAVAVHDLLLPAADGTPRRRLASEISLAVAAAHERLFGDL